MPSPSYTYSLTNGTTADASQVMQNFNDILNGITDGTKNLSISALTAGGTATFNGAVNLGSATDDDLTFNGSLASTIPIKTTATYNIGSATLGLASVYIGGTVSFTTRLMSAATASWTLTLPATAGTAKQILQNQGSGTVEWADAVLDGPAQASNYSLAVSVAGNALTIALKTQDAGDPTAADPVQIGFRNATIGTGDYSVVKATAATSLVIPSGATYGQANSVEAVIYVYALNNAGTIELAASGTPFNDDTVQSSTTIDTASDSAAVLYSTTGRSSKAIRLLARLVNTQTTAGTWAAAPSTIILGDEPYRAGLATGLKTGVAVAAGYIGQKITSGAMTETTSTSSTLADVTGASIALTAGVWSIHMNALLGVGGGSADAVGLVNVQLTDSANTIIGGNASVRNYMRNSSDNVFIGQSFTQIVNISSSTTYKLRIAAAGCTGYFRVNNDQSLTGDTYGTFYAVRIA